MHHINNNSMTLQRVLESPSSAVRASVSPQSSSSPMPYMIPPIMLPHQQNQVAYGNAQLRVRASPIARSANSAYSQHPQPPQPAAISLNAPTRTRSSSADSPTPSPPHSAVLHARGQHASSSTQTSLEEQETLTAAALYPEGEPREHAPPPIPSSLPQRFLNVATSLTPKRLVAAISPRLAPSYPKKLGSTPGGATSATIASRSTSSSSSSKSSLFLQLLWFVLGMIFTYILLTATSSEHHGRSEGEMMYARWFHQFKRSSDNEMNKDDLLIIGGSKASTTITLPTTVPAVAPTTAPAVVTPPATPILPLCGVDDYADGEWVFDETITKAPYISHEWDAVCDAEDAPLNDGSTLPKGTKRGLRSELQYRWKPNKCRLLAYSRKSFCELLNGRNILFAGDSIAGQHLSSFVHLMHSSPDTLWIRDDFFRYDMMNVCQDYYPLVKDEKTGEMKSTTNAGVHPLDNKPFPGIRVGFKRNNFLNLHTEHNTSETIEHRKWNTNQTWVKQVEKHKYDIVVINTGIWMIDAHIYKQMLTDINAYMKKYYPHVTVIWRSTQPGHAQCHSYWARPQKRLEGLKDTTGGNAKFRWEEADERNRIAKEIWKPEEFMDVISMTRLRPDGHMPGECLHYCQPGPVDEWHHILYHRLALMNQTFVQKIEASGMSNDNHISTP